MYCLGVPKDMWCDRKINTKLFSILCFLNILANNM